MFKIISVNCKTSMEYLCELCVINASKGIKKTTGGPVVFAVNSIKYL